MPKRPQLWTPPENGLAMSIEKLLKFVEYVEVIKDTIPLKGEEEVKEWWLVCHLFGPDQGQGQIINRTEYFSRLLR